MSNTYPKTVLVADDSEFFRIKTSDILTHAGYKVRFARDGGEVLKELKSNPSEIDLLMLDLQMPRINGFEVLRWLKKNKLKEELPVLVITGAYEAAEILRNVRELGATGLITKASTAEQLLFRINAILFKNQQGARQTVRIPITLPVDFTTFDGVVSTGFMLNLSKTGAFIYTNKKIAPGDTVNLKFSLPEEDKLIEADAKVVWINKLDNGDNLFKGIGIHFTAIGHEEQRIIERFVKKEAVRPM